jgi:hypothetical protein
MSLQEPVTGIADKSTSDSKNWSSSTSDCRVCLWVFESKSELDIHNCLEHMILTHLEEHKRNVEDHPIIQE